MKNLPNEIMEAGLALKPQNINTSAIAGETIEAPWKKGRFIVFDIIAGAFAAADGIVVKIQGRVGGSYNHGSTTTPEPYQWEDIQDKTGAADLAFDEQNDAGDLENGHITGTIDLNRLSTIATDGVSRYDAIRLSAINDNAANVIVGASYRITDLYENPGSVSDGLFSKQTSLGADV